MLSIGRQARKHGKWLIWKEKKNVKTLPMYLYEVGILNRKRKRAEGLRVFRFLFNRVRVQGWVLLGGQGGGGYGGVEREGSGGGKDGGEGGG